MTYYVVVESVRRNDPEYLVVALSDDKEEAKDALKDFITAPNSPYVNGAVRMATSEEQAIAEHRAVLEHIRLQEPSFGFGFEE